MATSDHLPSLSNPIYKDGRATDRCFTLHWGSSDQYCKLMEGRMNSPSVKHLWFQLIRWGRLSHKCDLA